MVDLTSPMSLRLLAVLRLPGPVRSGLDGAARLSLPPCEYSWREWLSSPSGVGLALYISMSFSGLPLPLLSHGFWGGLSGVWKGAL